MTTATQGALVDLVEFTRVTKARRIDEEAGVLYDLALLGPNSSNLRDYPEATMRKALPLLEGRQSFADHTAGGAPPSVYNVLGVWRECCVAEAKVRGNFNYFRTHPLAPRLVEAARRPELNTALGFSINAKGREKRAGGRSIIESIESVSSIDCVAQPATLGGLYEGKGTAMTFREPYTLIPAGRARLLREAADMAGLPDTASIAVPSGGTPEEALKAGFRAAMLAIIDDDKLTTAEKIAKVREFLKLQEKALGDTAPPPKEKEFKPAEDDAPMPESREARAAWLNAPEPSLAGTGLLLESRAANLLRAEVQRELRERVAASDQLPPSDSRERARWLRAG